MTPETRLTRDQIEAVMGRLDEFKLAEIIATGATAPELLEAKRWIAGDHRTVPDALPVRPSVVGAVCDIMGSDEPDWYRQDAG